MIVVMRVENAENENYDFIECPQCKRKLCEKPAVVKVTTIKSEEGKNGLSLHFLLQCNRCKSKYLIAIDKD